MSSVSSHSRVEQEEETGSVVKDTQPGRIVSHRTAFVCFGMCKYEVKRE